METQALEQPDDSAMDVHLEPAASPANYVLMPFSDVDEEQIRKEWLKKKRPQKINPKRSTVQRRFMALIVNARNKQHNSESDEDEFTSSSLTELSIEASPATDNNEAIDEEPSDDDDDDEGTVDAAGEEKIDSNGYLLGGRSYICPVFRSPFRRNPDKLYILAAECCRYTGLGSSQALCNKYPSLRRYRLITREREILYDNLSLNRRVFNSPTVYMFKARPAFKEFGALLVKNGRHMVDDYCEANWQSRDAAGPVCLSGQVVANMEAYRAFKANYILVQQPTSFASTAVRSDRPPQVKMSKEMSKHFLRPFPVVGSSVELMVLVSERRQQRREFVRNLRADIESAAQPVVQPVEEPMVPKCEKAENDMDKKWDLVPIVIDDSSDGDSESNDDSESSEDSDSSKGGLEPIVIDDSSD
ncbi:chromatin structure-remodeling complex subunit RSC7 [Coemansia sp. S146]|nr:chromatin structure-remodeling complex subunit RSC7 [Coemansia sp. S146]